MKTENNSVVDNKIITDEQIGKMYRKMNEIIRRIKEGTITYKDSIDVLQEIIIEGKAPSFLNVTNGWAEIILIENLIDCDEQSFSHKDWKVVEHINGGLLKFNPIKVTLYLSENQNNKSIVGYDLRKEFENKPILNADVLDYLLAHTELIPNEWVGKEIYFWGTVYSLRGELCVRNLEWNYNHAFWGHKCLSQDFNCLNYTAMLN